MDNKKDKRIGEIIKKISKKELKDEQEYNLILNELSEIYNDEGYRHRYNEVTTIILDIPNIYTIKNEEESDPLEIIPQNLRSIRETAKKKIDINKDVFEKIDKLYDHANLECERVKKFRSIFLEIESRERDIAKNLEQQQTQYITILGIFAAIVLAFVGGLTFSTSVLAHIHQASSYRLVFVMCFIALFVGNILYYLFDFLLKITDKKPKENVCFFKRPFFYFNLIIILFMLMSIASYICHSSIIDCCTLFDSQNE